MPEAAAPPAPPCLRAHGAGALLDVSVVPGARRTGADGLHDGALRVRLLARPIEGQANAALLDWLADALRCPRRALHVLRGANSRRKQIAIDLEPAVVRSWLQALLDEAAA